MDHVFNDDFRDDSSHRSRASKINLIPFNCNDVFRDENKEMEEEKGEKKKRFSRRKTRRKRDGIKRLRTRTIRWKKRKGRDSGRRKPRGWTREREKNMLKDRREGDGKKNPRDGEEALYKFRDACALVGSTRPISNGSTHYDNCILRIYKTK